MKKLNMGVWKRVYGTYKLINYCSAPSYDTIHIFCVNLALKTDRQLFSHGRNKKLYSNRCLNQFHENKSLIFGSKNPKNFLHEFIDIHTEYITVGKVQVNDTSICICCNGLHRYLLHFLFTQVRWIHTLTSHILLHNGLILQRGINLMFCINIIFSL